MPPPASDFMIVGRVRKPHGLRGELIVTSITDSPDAVFAPGRRVLVGTVDGDLAEAGDMLSVVASRPFKEGLIVRFAEVHDRTAAEQWRDRYLLIPASELTPPAAGEVYIHDLIGMRVALRSGEVVGVVGDVYEVPQGLLLAVAREPGTGGDLLLLPFGEEVVQSVDVDARVLVIDPPEGML